ncbi:MAG: adenosine kinase [Bacteroidales bacterium]|nr:adenosine kinase [Candidatus Cryptobacteroides aphodequi]
MKSILGIGNALTDILAVLPDDSLLKTYHLPKGSMQHVDMETGDKIWAALKPLGVKYVAGGSAANTITCTAIFGMPSSFIGKIGDDELGLLFKSDQEQYGVKTLLLKSEHSSGRSMVFVSGGNAERTFAVYLGAALDLVPEDLKPEYFQGHDYFHIEGYLVQNQALIRRAVELAHEAGCIISLDMASYNVVESNEAFLHDIVDKYVDIVFANETEARAFTHLADARESLAEIAKHCSIAVVKVGKDGSWVRSGDEEYYIAPWPADTIDATGAGDTYAAGFLYAHSLGMPLKECGEVGSIIAAKVVEVIGTKIDIPRWRDAKKEIRELISRTGR